NHLPRYGLTPSLEHWHSTSAGATRPYWPRADKATWWYSRVLAPPGPLIRLPNPRHWRYRWPFRRWWRHPDPAWDPVRPVIVAPTKHSVPAAKQRVHRA